MVFSKGDKVAYLNTTGEGVVIDVKGDQLLVEDENGFSEWYRSSELVHRGSIQVGEVRSKDHIKRKVDPHKKYAPNKMVVDLHFEALVDYPKNFTAHQKLEIQLAETRKAINKCKISGIKKLILIHGVGEGRLKEEIHTLLERMDKLQFYDASLAEYGRGATELEFY